MSPCGKVYRVREAGRKEGLSDGCWASPDGVHAACNVRFACSRFMPCSKGLLSAGYRVLPFMHHA